MYYHVYGDGLCQNCATTVTKLFGLGSQFKNAVDSISTDIKYCAWCIKTYERKIYRAHIARGHISGDELIPPAVVFNTDLNGNNKKRAYDDNNDTRLLEPPVKKVKTSFVVDNIGLVRPVEQGGANPTTTSTIITGPLLPRVAVLPRPLPPHPLMLQPSSLPFNTTTTSVPTVNLLPRVTSLPRAPLASYPPLPPTNTISHSSHVYATNSHTPLYATSSLSQAMVTPTKTITTILPSIQLEFDPIKNSEVYTCQSSFFKQHILLGQINLALKCARYYTYSKDSDEKHLMWIITQMVMALCGSVFAYEAWKTEYAKGPKGPNQYYWDYGIKSPSTRSLRAIPIFSDTIISKVSISQAFNSPLCIKFDIAETSPPHENIEVLEEWKKCALQVAHDYGDDQAGGEAHKYWMIDQMVQALCGGGNTKKYKTWVDEYAKGLDGLENHVWPIGCKSPTAK
jgi:hypothetical protein